MKAAAGRWAVAGALGCALLSVAPPVRANGAAPPVVAPDQLVRTPSGGGAQEDPISNPRALVANFDVANVTPLLDELGLLHETRTTEDGQTFIVASDGGNLSFNIVPAACLNANKTRCIGVIVIALFSGSANPQTVSAFNQRFVFSSAGIVSEGAYLSRYDIADYGIPRGNFASSLATFVYVADQFRQALASGSKTVSLDGYPSDLSARLLNLKSAEAVGVARAAGAGPDRTPHRLDIEAAPESVEALWRAGAPVNRLRRE